MTEQVKEAVRKLSVHWNVSDRSDIVELRLKYASGLIELLTNEGYTHHVVDQEDGHMPHAFQERGQGDFLIYRVKPSDLDFLEITNPELNHFIREEVLGLIKPPASDRPRMRKGNGKKRPELTEQITSLVRTFDFPWRVEEASGNAQVRFDVPHMLTMTDWLQEKGFRFTHADEPKALAAARSRKSADILTHIELLPNGQRDSSKSYIEILHPAFNRFIKEELLGLEPSARRGR